MAGPDPYEVLGVAPGCEQDEITAAYRALSQRVHPDRTIGMAPAQRQRATEAMVALNQAYALIGAPAARQRFDEGRVTSTAAGPATPAATRAASAPPPPARPGPTSGHRLPVLGALAAVALLVIGALTIYRVRDSAVAPAPPTTGIDDAFPTTPRDAAPKPVTPPGPVTEPPLTQAPLTEVTTPPRAPSTELTIVPLQPLNPPSTTLPPAPLAPTTLAPTGSSASADGAPGCWFVQVASTPDPNVGVEWARPAVIIESPLLPMYFVSYQEWPDGLPVGTVLAGTVAISQADGVALLEEVRQAGVGGAFLRPMPARVCRALVPFS